MEARSHRLGLADWASVGVEPEGTYMDTTLLVKDSFYAQHTTGIEFTESGSEVRNPALTGTDPNAARSGKLSALDWAISSLSREQVQLTRTRTFKPA